MGPDAERSEELFDARTLSDHRPGARPVAVRARRESGGRQPERSARSQAAKSAIAAARADAPREKRPRARRAASKGESAARSAEGRGMTALLEVKNLRVK